MVAVGNPRENSALDRPLARYWQGIGGEKGAGSELSLRGGAKTSVNVREVRFLGVSAAFCPSPPDRDWPFLQSRLTCLRIIGLRDQLDAVLQQAASDGPFA